MNKCFFLFSFCIILAFVSSRLSGQTVNGLKVNPLSAKKISVQFPCDKEVGNIVVMVSDSVGTTLFLDSRYRFKGDYNWTVDMLLQPKGNYMLDILKDNEKQSIKFLLK